MRKKLRIIAISFAALTLANCGSDGWQRTVYEALNNIGRRQCMGDPGRDPAECNDVQNHVDYRSRRDAYVQ
nr:MAG: hypothetical protein E4H34_05130 [Hyphomicrobiales bacterium]